MATATSIDQPKALLHVQDLACQRGERLLFDGLSLTVSAGQAVWVRGPNGQGKTSLLRLMAGLSQPAAGRVQAHAAVLYIGHQHALKDDLTSLEALAFLQGLHGQATDRLTLVAALERMGVKAKREAFVRTLSQGQRRRVALSRLALAPAGGLWILDEPFDALDDQGVATLNDLLVQHARSGGAVVLTSHQAVTLPDVHTLVLNGPVKG